MHFVRICRKDRCRNDRSSYKKRNIRTLLDLVKCSICVSDDPYSAEFLSLKVVSMRNSSVDVLMWFRNKVNPSRIIESDVGVMGRFVKLYFLLQILSRTTDPSVAFYECVTRVYGASCVWPCDPPYQKNWRCSPGLPYLAFATDSLIVCEQYGKRRCSPHMTVNNSSSHRKPLLQKRMPSIMRNLSQDNNVLLKSNNVFGVSYFKSETTFTP